jgi:glycerol-3-phosphate dehydrogenase
LIGTTDTDFKGDPDHVRAEEEDIDYLLKETVRVLPGERLSRTDVRATFAGLRPLSAASTPDAGASKVSREHTFWEEPGVLAVTGGKYTTYRSLCEALVERAARRLGRKLGPRFSGGRPLPGAPRPGENPEQSAAERLAGTDAPQGAPALLAARYGRYAGAVAELATENPNLARAVAPGSDCPAILAQAAWAARHERALHLDDFYLRRSRLGLLLPPDHRGVDAAATAMGRELGWDSDREARELERLKRAVDGEFR